MSETADHPTDDELIAFVARRYGSDFQKPERVPVGDLSLMECSTFEEVLEAVTGFAEEYRDEAFKIEADINAYEYSDTGGVCEFTAYRLETDAEVSVRIQGYLREAYRQITHERSFRRSQYEALKREFGDT